VLRQQEEDTVKTVTGMSLTMLHMAQRASEQSVRHAHSRANALQRTTACTGSAHARSCCRTRTSACCSRSSARTA